MADFLAVYTNAGRTLDAANRAAGRGTPIDSVEIGRGNRTPDGTETGVTVPFIPAMTFRDPAGSASGGNWDLTFNDPSIQQRSGIQYDVREIAFLSGGTCVYYVSIASGIMFSKPYNTALLIPLAGTYSSDELDNFTFASAGIPVGSTTVAGLVRLTRNVQTDPIGVVTAKNLLDELTRRTSSVEDTNAGVGAGFVIASRLRAAVRLLQRYPSAATTTLAGLVRLATSTQARETSTSRQSETVVMSPARTWDMILAWVGNAASRISSLKVSAPAAVALTDRATITWSLSSAEVATVTLGGNRTLAVPTGGEDNRLYLLRVTQDTTGSRTLTLHASIDRGGLPAPRLSTTAGLIDVLAFMRFGGSVRYMGIVKGY